MRRFERDGGPLSRIKTMLGKHQVLDYDFYYKYNKLKKKKSFKKEHRINQRGVYIKFCREFFNIIQEELLEREAGVCIKGLGYFYIHLVPLKEMRKYFDEDGNMMETSWFLTDGHRYKPNFIPSKRFRYWALDNSFADRLNNNLHKNLIAGKRYNAYPYSTKKLI